MINDQENVAIYFSMYVYNYYLVSKVFVKRIQLNFIPIYLSGLNVNNKYLISYIVHTSNPCASTNEIAFNIGSGTSPRGSLRCAARCSGTPQIVKSKLWACFGIGMVLAKLGGVVGIPAELL